jgi:hypothetical protein
MVIEDYLEVNTVWTAERFRVTDNGKLVGNGFTSYSDAFKWMDKYYEHESSEEIVSVQTFVYQPIGKETKND